MLVYRLYNVKVIGASLARALLDHHAELLLEIDSA
jgi:hypothetical protein